ncbi:MAG: Cof-type HAD-IIB family hydrolase [Propionibacteriaceae bacterium]|jgi:hydroxymethylpyrimidine pyrophosphatase-like HAD family hydrolase|nr:Cof-type HAD-IIB family hydrolase [Propionibacteriaceae bacterium]
MTPLWPQLSGVAVRLVATDLDGTLLASDKTVSARTRRAIAAAEAAGVHVVANTGRSLSTIPEDVLDTAITYALASNGAVGYQFGAAGDDGQALGGGRAAERRAGRVLFFELIASETLRDIVDFFGERLPGTVFGVNRGVGETFLAEPGYLTLARDGETVGDRRRMREAGLDELLAEPSIKIVARHRDFSPDQLLALLASSGLEGFHATTSGAPFLEIAAAGVTKASGLVRLASSLGVTRDQVVAVGDAKNDVEMLRWAQVGAAMANSVPEALAAADIVLPGNDDDGLAQLLETLVA